MTTTTAETRRSAAQQAVVTAGLIAMAAETQSKPGALAYLRAKITRPEFVAATSGVILRAISRARLAGMYWAAREHDASPDPMIVTDADIDHIVDALDTIADDLHRDLDQLDQELDDLDQDSEEPDVIMRTQRLAHAETIKAGRQGYAHAVAQIAPGASWRFVSHPGACERCEALALLTFDTFEDAPVQGAHPRCTCTLQPTNSGDRNGEE